MKITPNILVLPALFVLAVLGTWQSVSATESGQEGSAFYVPAWLSTVDPPVSATIPPVLADETPSPVEQSCHAEDCGNTGTLYGYGATCTAAKADLDSEIGDASYSICPGVVTGVDRHYVACIELNGQCRYEGNADIECKICPGQFCW